MAKNTPKAPAAPADAPTTDATAPDTTEANNANGYEQPLVAADGDQPATEPTADGAAQPEAAPPEVTDADGEQPPIDNTPPPPMPKRIRLVTPYGFYDDAEQLRMWQAGHETDAPDEIELLVTRGAEFEFLE